MKFVLAGLAVSALCADGFAQNPIGASAGVGSFGGGFRPPPAALNRMARPLPARYPLYSYGGYRGLGYGGFGYGGFGGGFITSNYLPYYVVPGPSYYLDDALPPPTPTPPVHIVELSGELPATLTIDFPTTATIWLNDNQLSEKAETAKMTSPVLRPGEQFTYHIRARWEKDGKTFEYKRDVALGPGDRGRVTVVNGTAVK